MTAAACMEHLSVATAAVSGVLAAAGRRIDFFGVVVLAGVTAFGGGTLRDALMREIPLVFRREIHLYATAAFLGAAFYALAPRGGWLNEPVVHAASLTIILGLRLAAIKWRLALPDFVARGS